MHRSAAHPRPGTRPEMTGTLRHLAARAGALATMSMLLVSALVSPASAAKKAEPASTGVVERFDTIGGHVIEPIPIDVGGEIVPVLTVVGWDAAVPGDDDQDGFGGFCVGEPPVFNGVQQTVVTPAGNDTIVVHNADVPVLLFDVSGVDSREEFDSACASGDLEPLAQGTVKQRPIINVTEDGVTSKVKSRGVVTDASGQQWQLQAFYRESFDFAAPEDAVVTSWVSLRRL